MTTKKEINHVIPSVTYFRSHYSRFGTTGTDVKPYLALVSIGHCDGSLLLREYDCAVGSSYPRWTQTDGVGITDLVDAWAWGIYGDVTREDVVNEAYKRINGIEE